MGRWVVRLALLERRVLALFTRHLLNAWRQKSRLLILVVHACHLLGSGGDLALIERVVVLVFDETCRLDKVITFALVTSYSSWLLRHNC